MKFYSSIAENYDFIFPVKLTQIEFVSSLFELDSNLIEIGSGTGNLTIELVNSGYFMSALEFDNEMLKLAINKSSDVCWKNGDMREIDQIFQNEIYDGIICFGNTLVHLKNENEINQFIKKSFDLLQEGGIIAIQIINYSRIFENEIDYLPTIENEKIKFIRDYVLEDNPRNVEFNTTLVIKSKDQSIKNSINLYPILPKELKSLLKNIGFNSIKEYGSFEKDKFNSNSISYIVTGQK